MDAETGKTIAQELLRFFFVPFGLVLLLTLTRDILVQ